MTQTAPMVIIGAGMAGARGCINLRANGYVGAITLIGEEALLPYDRPPLSKSSIMEEQTPEPVWLMDAAIARELNVDVLLNVSAKSIDRKAKSVELNGGNSIAYSKLLLATGAKPRSLNCPGGEHALTLRDYKDTLELRQRFQPGKNIVIIGGGFIGLELASSAIKRGCAVTLVEAQPRILMRGVPETIAKIVHAKHVAAGVVMLTGVGLQQITRHDVLLSDGRSIAADTVIAGIGAAPETQLAHAAGLAIDNGIACNAMMQTSDAEIFAAGDCASFVHPHFSNRRIRLEAWRSAQEQAATAAENMCGGSKAHKTMPWFWSDQYDLSLQIAGMADMGPFTVERKMNDNALIQFHLADDGTLMGASGIGPGNSIARDVKLAEMMIAKSIKPDASALADPATQLKALLKG